jgi:DNA-binding transcriptional ArsR family regulator
VKKGLEGEVAGEIAAVLKVAANKLSFHLKALTHANLVSVEQEGRFQRYRANLPLMVDLVRYLTEECCSGHPEECSDIEAPANCCTIERPVKRIRKKRG